MKNEYEIRGEVTAIFLNSKKYGKLEALICTTDLEKVLEYPNTWRACYDKKLQNFYVLGRIYSYQKSSTITLHRWIIQPPKELVVDHINHNSLDNRRENLREVSHLFNIKHSNPNKKPVQKQRKPMRKYGIGISWHKSRQKWIAYKNVNGKQVHLGYFKEKEDALKVVQAAET